MDFDDQSLEMKRTLLKASVGGVTMSAHLLETNLKLILFSCLGIPDERFDNEWNSPRTLGKIIKELEAFKIFSEKEMTEIASAKDARNSFTHCLSDFFSESMNSSGSMFELIQRFESIKSRLDKINSVVTKKLHDQAQLGGVDVNGIQNKARNVVDFWEST